MGLFDFFFKRNNNNDSNNALELVTVSPNLRLPKIMAGMWPAIQKMKLDSIAIEKIAENNLSIQQSKFGHFPILPRGFEYPFDLYEKPMLLLAQINFSEMPPLDGYPTSGYLQFYISGSDDVYGLDFDDPQNQRNFRVLFFEEKDVLDFQTDFSFWDELDESDQFPFSGSYALKFQRKVEYLGMGDVRTENAGINFSGIEDLYPKHSDEICEFLYNHYSPNGHKLGGYAHFTQEDPRNYQDQFKDYILLLQIDSDDDIIWGDCGVANFFIHPDDLKRKDFSKVMYNWDCS